MEPRLADAARLLDLKLRPEQSAQSPEFNLEIRVAC